jgi:hypothetical protein
MVIALASFEYIDKQQETGFLVFHYGSEGLGWPHESPLLAWI